MSKRSFVLLAAFVAAPFACTADNAPDTGGLMLIVDQDAELGIDRLVIDIGSNGVPVRSSDLKVPADTTLPTSLGIASNGDGATSVTIAVSAFRGDGAIDRRDLLVKNVPTDHVATVNVLLSGRCTSLVSKEGPFAKSLCAMGSTCDPATGACATSEVDGTKLPPYDPKTDPTVDATAGGDANDGGADAVGDARGGLVSCTGATEKRCDNKCVSVLDPAYGCGGPTCTSCDVDGSTVWGCNAGACSLVACASGFKLCAGKCVAIDDPNYGCGPATCDAASCPGAAQALVCDNGTCKAVASCPAGTKKCGGNRCVAPSRTYGCEGATCNACAGTDTCQGSPSACTCTPDNVTACKDKECGPTTNNCGATITCPDTCGPAAACVGNVCGCVPESTETLCAGKCGKVIDKCNRVIDCPDICVPNVEFCGVVTPNKCDLPPSCVGGGAGKTDCRGNESCCLSMIVPGGPFKRAKDPTIAASVSSFRLDKYKVTVGRFRAFVKAWLAGWRPASGAGKHVHLNLGQGLFTQRPPAGPAAYESGWVSGFANALPSTQLEWDSALGSGNFSTLGFGELLPIGMVQWHEAYAFCIWDGGFLPTFAELNYALEGGNENRTYPWGEATPTTSHADFCPAALIADAGAQACNPKPQPVGSKSLGDGRWGHTDLVGGVWTWALDTEKTVPLEPNCAEDCVGAGGARYLKMSGSSSMPEPTLEATYVTVEYPNNRAQSVSTPGAMGFRCARVP